MQPTDPDTRTAACGYWDRRGLRTEPDQVLAAPSAPLLLLGLLAAAPGGLVLPCPSASWHSAPARLLGRSRHPVPVPSESGGVPDPFALVETVRRARDDGADPRVLLLSVADDPTGTAPPPELLHEVCEAAVNAGLLIVSDETWRDTFHDPHDTVVVSPAEILPEPAAVPVVVLVDLGAALLPAPLSAAIARFPADARGRALADAVGEVLRVLHTGLDGPVLDVVAEALTEPARLRQRRADTARVQGPLAAALCRAVTTAGGLCRPPHAGRHLYVDLEPLRSALAARGIVGAAELEAELVRALGPYVHGGHRFGDDPRALRVRLETALLTAGAPVEERSGADPGEWPGPARMLRTVQRTLTALTQTGA